MQQTSGWLQEIKWTLTPFKLMSFLKVPIDPAWSKPLCYTSKKKFDNLTRSCYQNLKLCDFINVASYKSKRALLVKPWNESLISYAQARTSSYSCAFKPWATYSPPPSLRFIWAWKLLGRLHSCVAPLEKGTMMREVPWGKCASEIGSDLTVLSLTFWSWRSNGMDTKRKSPFRNDPGIPF